MLRSAQESRRHARKYLYANSLDSETQTGPKTGLISRVFGRLHTVSTEARSSQAIRSTMYITYTCNIMNVEAFCGVAG
jgi:hypothetical protein